MVIFRMPAIRAAVWVALETVGGSVFSSIGLLIIASIIGPRNLGLSTIALVIIQTANFFPDTLFHDAIIQRKRLTTRHIGSAFWGVCALSLMISLIVAGLSYPLSRMYDEPSVFPLLLVLSTSSIFSGIISIQSARLRRAMRMRMLAIYAVISRSSATLVGLILALGGFGPWAMVAQYEVGLVVFALLLAMTTRWGFLRCFSFRQAGELGRFAVTRTFSHFIDAARNRLFFVLVANYLPLQVLGEVSLAFRLVDSLTNVVSSAVSRFCLPLFSRAQTDNRNLAVSLWQASGTAAVILMPVYAILALTGDNLVHLFAGKQWQNMQGLILWLSVAGLVVVLWTPAYCAIIATGRPGLLAIVSSLLMLGLAVTIWVTKPASGLQAVICWMGPLLAAWPATFVITRYAVGLSIRNQLTCLVPALVSSALVTGAILVARHLLSLDTARVIVFSEVAIAGLTYAGFIVVLYFVFMRSVDVGRQLVWIPHGYSGKAR